MKSEELRGHVGKKWRIDIETDEVIGDGFLEGAIPECVGVGCSVKVRLLEELSDKEFEDYLNVRTEHRKSIGMGEE